MRWTPLVRAAPRSPSPRLAHAGCWSWSCVSRFACETHSLTHSLTHTYMSRLDLTCLVLTWSDVCVCVCVSRARAYAHALALALALAHTPLGRLPHRDSHSRAVAALMPRCEKGVRLALSRRERVRLAESTLSLASRMHAQVRRASLSIGRGQ